MWRDVFSRARVGRVRHTLKSRIDLSAALELGADSAHCLVQLAVERSGLELRQSFPTGRCCLAALVTVGHDLIAPCEAQIVRFAKRISHNQLPAVGP